MSIRVTVEGADELNRLLEELSGPELKRVTGRATADAAKKVLKPAAQAEAGKVSANFRRHVRAGAVRRDRPGGIVKIDPKLWYRHFVLGGTKPHRIRFPDQKARGVPKTQGNIRHPGARANPIFDRVERSHGDRAVDFVADALSRHFDLD